MFIIVYHSSSYSELLIAKNEPTLHQHSTKILIKELYKLSSSLSPPLIDGMFQIPHFIAYMFQVRKNTF